MQNELETLLRRWSELEPDRCIIDSRGFIHFPSLEAGDTNPSMSVWDAEYTLDRMTLLNPNECRLFLAIAQGAIQEAIEARGWEWTTGRTTNFLNQMFVWANVMGVVGIADTPAAALLTAYLSALEAQNADAR